VAASSFNGCVPLALSHQWKVEMGYHDQLEGKEKTFTSWAVDHERASEIAPGKRKLPAQHLAAGLLHLHFVLLLLLVLLPL